MDALPQLGLTLGREERLRIRSGGFTGNTVGLAPGNVQANLVILPQALAHDFLRFAQANPKPCPILAVSEPGDPLLPTLGHDVDLQADLHATGSGGGEWSRNRPTSATCGVTTSSAASPSAVRSPSSGADRGRHRAAPRHPRPQRADVPDFDPMRRRACSMWTVGGLHATAAAGGRDPRRADHRALSVGARCSGVSGLPNRRHHDATLPDYGDGFPVGTDELPVFWACGVTPQAAIAAARPEFCITHAPGSM